MTEVIYLQDTQNTVFVSGNYLYIDSNKNLDKKILGVKTTEYDIGVSDIVFKKHKFLSKRDSLTGTRYLHTIHKTRSDDINKLCKSLDLTYFKIDTSDTRKRILKTSDTVIIDYTDLSYAIFTSNKKVTSFLYKANVFFNSGLTGPDNVKSPGFILTKKNAAKDDLLEDIIKLAESCSYDSYIGNDFIQEPSRRGRDVYKVWGNTTYVLVQTMDIFGDSNKDIFTSEAKELPDGRLFLEIEIDT